MTWLRTESWYVAGLRFELRSCWLSSLDNVSYIILPPILSMEFGLHIVIIKLFCIYSPATVAFLLLPEYTKYVAPWGFPIEGSLCLECSFLGQYDDPDSSSNFIISGFPLPLSSLMFSLTLFHFLRSVYSFPALEINLFRGHGKPRVVGEAPEARTRQGRIH